MLYQKYKQRLDQCLNALKALWRFRYFLLLGIGLLIALLGVLLGISGNVYAVKCPETIIYGSDYTIKGQAVMQKATVQYRELGTWFDEKPKLVGTYEVRAVSKGVNGKTKIGKSSYFTIVPQEVELKITGGAFLYGEMPSVYADLSYQDRILGESFDFDWEDECCYVTPHVECVLDESGRDVTNCYTLLSAPCRTSVLPRPITVSTESASKTYDGTPLKAESYTLIEGTLETGDSFSVDFPAMQIDAGKCSNIPNCKIFGKDGKDITKYYNITVQAGTLEVIPREIKVKTGSQTWIYDGKPHSLCEPDDYQIEGLLEGHSAIVTDATELTEITDTEEDVVYRKNRIVLGICDQDGKDITKNYDIFYEYGQLRIKTPILIFVYSVSKVYDGRALQFETEDVYFVKPPDVTVLIDFPELSLTQVGKIPLSAVMNSPVHVNDTESKEDVRSENRWEFIGEADKPILEVEKRTIEVTSISIASVLEFSLNGWESEHPAWISFGSLAPGQRIEIEVTGVLYFYEEKADNTISSVKIFDESNVDVTINYEIILRMGELKWL